MTYIDLNLTGYTLGTTTPRIKVTWPPRPNMLRCIQERVADFYGLPLGEMVSARRSKSVAWPRQVAMYLSRELTPCSLPDIGRRFGGRDHTTVIHAIKQVEKRIAEIPDIRDDVAALRDLIAA